MQVAERVREVKSDMELVTGREKEKKKKKTKRWRAFLRKNCERKGEMSEKKA